MLWVPHLMVTFWVPVTGHYVGVNHLYIFSPEAAHDQTTLQCENSSPHNEQSTATIPEK